MRGRAVRWALAAGWALLACDGDSASTDGGVDGRDAATADAAVADRTETGAEGGGDRPVDVTDAPVESGADGTAEAPPLGPTQQLDLLFVIDNSSSMREEQDALRAAFPAFIQALQAAPGGLPDLRLAIVNTNFGAGPTTPSAECTPLGDRGQFQARPNCGLNSMVGGFFLATDGKGAQNFTGSLSEVFSCLALQGTSGCGYEHQLQSLRAALAGGTEAGCAGCPLENRGFLRQDARLGIVILSDEDDCSGEPDAEVFRDLVPGQAGSFRCALLGHVCNGQAVPAIPGFEAPLASCAPYVRSSNERTSRLINVQEFVDFVGAVKSGRPDHVFVSVIMGWNDPASAWTPSPAPSSTTRSTASARAT